MSSQNLKRSASVRHATIRLTRMNNARGLRRLSSFTDCPLPNFIWASGEETTQMKHASHSCDYFWKHWFRSEPLAFLCCFSIIFKTRQTLFKGDWNRNYGVSRGVCLDPLGNLGKMLVFLANVISFAQVDKVNDRLRCKKEKRIDNFDLVGHGQQVA